MTPKPITTQERAVLAMRADGLLLREIADKLGISREGATTILHRAERKETKAQRFNQLKALAQTAGLIQTTD